MRPRINIEKVTEILSQPRLRLAVGRYVDFNGCHCAAGELAHYGGVGNDTLRAADAVTNHGPYILDETATRGDAAATATRKRFDVACKMIDDVLLNVYGLLPTDRDVITWANDHAECDIAERPSFILARLRDHIAELDESGAFA